MKKIKFKNLCVFIITEILKEQKETGETIRSILNKYSIKQMDYYKIKAIATNDVDSNYMKGRRLEDSLLIEILDRLGYNAERIYSLEPKPC